MLCASPITLRVSDGKEQKVGCGQCLSCTINKRRAWTARILLEAKACEANYGEVSFSTLTYNEDAVPTIARGRDGAPFDNLAPTDYQRVFKRMRKRDTGVGRFRFVLCGEYGDKTQRPHYHALFFGPPTSLIEKALQEHWEPEFGHTRTSPWRVGSDGTESDETAVSRAAYVANYVTKKLNDNSPDLGPRRPEFFRCSRRPALGWSQHLVDLVYTNGGAQLITEQGDVPSQIRIGGKLWPLARVLREHLRDELGIPQNQLERIPGTQPKVQPTAQEYYQARINNEKMVRRGSKWRRTERV